MPLHIECTHTYAYIHTYTHSHYCIHAYYVPTPTRTPTHTTDDSTAVMSSSGAVEAALTALQTHPKVGVGNQRTPRTHTLYLFLMH